MIYLRAAWLVRAELGEVELAQAGEVRDGRQQRVHAALGVFDGEAVEVLVVERVVHERGGEAVRRGVAGGGERSGSRGHACVCCLCVFCFVWDRWLYAAGFASVCSRVPFY